MRSNEAQILDTNIVLRFLLKDHPSLSPQAKNTIVSGNNYLDEVIFAEIIWVLTSYYRKPRQKIADQLEKLLSLKNIVNPRKTLLIQALQKYRRTSLAFPDCWILAVSQTNKIPLKTFDTALQKIFKR